jgi:phosphomannomutase
MHSAAATDLFATLQSRGHLSPEALQNLKQWLDDPSLAEFRPEIQALVERGDWDELEDAFYKHINIGTGGIRGAIGPGPNRINTRTIGEAAQALCQFIDARGAEARKGGVVVGHEARQGSLDFARVCCEVFAANGIRALRFDGVRSTPEISFAVRHLHATAGVQITASHNPKTDTGFTVQPVIEQLEPDASFPTAAGKLINPEYREVVAIPIEFAERVGADLAICADPDADRAAVAARPTADDKHLELLRGDDVGATLTHFVLQRRQQLGLSTPNDLVLETFVTTSLIADIAKSFGVECVSDLNVGFKWMAQIIQQREDSGRVGFFLATEESIGYLAGNFVRDKDAAIAALLVGEMASALKDRGATAWTYLDELYAQYGCYRNLQHLVELPGKTGMQVMREVMLGLRLSPPLTLGGQPVVRVMDRLPAAKSARASYSIGSGDDMVTFVLSDDMRNRVTVRPSGTEPKLKYYIQLYEPVPASGDVAAVREPLSARALEVAKEIVDLSGTVIGSGLPASDAAQVDIWRKEWAGGVRRLV